jgi:hypothetical protein
LYLILEDIPPARMTAEIFMIFFLS